jgi:hypothetical protein
MAFLDNSGDIILDAVLTDTGRLRLAQGDGSFKITKFALGDDEINYGNYNKDHASGSAYYDLEIMQTPVLEAFTNNTSNLNTKLMSIARTNILYMPQLLLNKRTSGGAPAWQHLDSYMYYRKDGNDSASSILPAIEEDGGTRFVVAVDDTTWKILATGSATLNGAIQGYIREDSEVVGGQIRVDQGLASVEISPAAGMDSDLVETQYIVELDYRLGRICHPHANAMTDVNFIDDDNIASYYVTGQAYTRSNTNTTASAAITNEDTQVFDGPRGTSLFFRLRASTELQYSNYLFTQIGQTLTGATIQTQLGINASTMSDASATSAYILDTTIRIIGANTGYRIDVPVRYLKIE